MFKRSKQDKTEYSDSATQNERITQVGAALMRSYANLSNKIDIIEQKLDTMQDGIRLLEFKLCSQPVEPVGKATAPFVKNVYLDEVTPDAEPDEARNGKLRRVYYSKDPVGYIERKIYNATSAHKTATCIFLSALLTAVNSPASDRRKHITASKLVEHLLELLADKRIIAVKAKPRKTKVPSGDIGFQLASSEAPVRDRYSIISEEEATEILNLFVRWSNG